EQPRQLLFFRQTYAFGSSGFNFERRCWHAGQANSRNDDSNPYDGRQQIPCRSRPGRATAQMVVQKMQVVVQKMQVKPSFSFKPYLPRKSLLAERPARPPMGLRL